MLRVRLKKSDSKETDYLYKFGVECLGRAIEFGLSQKEYAKLRDLGNHYFQSIRKRVKKGDLQVHTSRKPATREKEAEAS